MYEPREPLEIKTVETLRDWAANEIRAFAEYIGTGPEVRLIQLNELNAEPAKPRAGMIVLADGTNWNPGSGAGFYGYYNGSWTKLG